MTQSKGIFTVKSTSNPPLGEAQVGHMTFHKRFEGELDAAGVVEMLHVQGHEKGSAAYVAIEHITGKLQGRSGSFCTHHTGVMNRGVPSLSVLIVPDSGTDQLKGLAGSMQIDIVDGQHFYTIDFTLPATE